MPWNEPGDNNSNKPDPWGNKRGDAPPDLDKILADFVKKLRGMLGGKKNKDAWPPAPSSPGGDLGLVGGFVIVVLAVLWFVSGLFIVNPAEEAVILRFGKFASVVPPGLHWYARFIDTKYLVDIQKIYSFSLQGDFLTKSSEQNDLPTQYVQLGVDKKADGVSDQSKNLVNVEMNVQYRISDARDYLFNVVNPDDTIQQVAEGALSAVIGTMKLDEVLTTGRESLSQGVFERVKQIVGTYHAGLEVVAVTLKKVQAPDQVQEAFNDVNRADQDKATYIQQAQAYASKVVPIAQGNAARVLASANAYQQQVVLLAQANIAKYQALLQVYRTSPGVTRERMYLDAMQAIMQKTTKIVVDGGAGNNLVYLPLDKLIAANRNNKLPEMSASAANVSSSNGAGGV